VEKNRHIFPIYHDPIDSEIQLDLIVR
jgi:hypothetical protein